MGAVIYYDFVGKKRLATKIIKEEEEKIPDMPEQSVLDKLSYFAELVGNGTTAIKIKTAHEKVELPEGFKKVPELTLNFSHTFNPSDLKYDELGVRQTLSFKGQMFATKIPWEAVSYIALAHGGRARTWVVGNPPKLISFANSQFQKEKPDPKPPPLVA